MADSWDGWKLGWQHMFFGLLLAVQLTRPDLLTGEPVLRVGLLAALVGWYAYWFGPWHTTRRPARRMVPYLVGAIALWLVLVMSQAEFWSTGFAVFVPLAMSLPALAASVVAVCGSLWLTLRATGSTLAWPEIVATALLVGAGVACLGYVAALDREGRKRAVVERQAATLAERQRLAREVHDTLTQGFASIILLLEAIQEDRDGAAAPLDRHIATALRTARDNLIESRRLVWALQPSSLDTVALPDAVRQQTARLAEETGIAATTVVTGDPIPLEPSIESGILRVVQEAITNARRHARATTVTVTLAYDPDLVLADIQDNGAGLPAGPPRTGLGLRAMHQRATEIGATLTIESDPGEGTTIALAVPTHAPSPLEAGT